MKRDDPTAFSPETEKWAPAAQEAPAAGLPPGPSPEWSARCVIEALEPLLLDERRLRLERALRGRLDSVVAVLDNPHDPHNGSAIVRTCDAFGIQELHLLCERKPFLTSRNVSKGTDRWVDLVEHDDPAELIGLLKRRNYKIVATHPEGRLDLEDLRTIDRIALVLGNEHFGVSQAMSEAADDTVRIRMSGFVESLNVSVSAALCLRAATHGRQGDLTRAQQENVYARWLRATVPRSDDVLAALPVNRSGAMVPCP